jgi:hypothetical protein
LIHFTEEYLAIVSEVFEVQSYSKFGREKFGPFPSSVVRSWVV